MGNLLDSADVKYEFTFPANWKATFTKETFIKHLREFRGQTVEDLQAQLKGDPVTVVCDLWLKTAASFMPSYMLKTCLSAKNDMDAYAAQSALVRSVQANSICAHQFIRVIYPVKQFSLPF